MCVQYMYTTGSAEWGVIPFSAPPKGQSIAWEPQATPSMSETGLVSTEKKDYFFFAIYCRNPIWL